MSSLITKALDSFIGCAGGALITDGDSINAAALGSTALYSMSRSPGVAENLKGEGYSHQDEFIVLPSRTTPRWFVPMGDADTTVAATGIYEPHHWAAKLTKRGLVSLLRMGWRGWPCPSVLLALRQRSPLHALVCKLTGENKVLFCLSVGRQPTVRKLTVQVMRPGGMILGYVKIGLTEAATARVRAEARVLERLWQCPELRPYIPRLIYSGDWSDTHLLFQSPLEGASGPARFGQVHATFLDALYRSTAVGVPGEKIVQDLEGRWTSSLVNLPGEWDSLGREVFRSVCAALEGSRLRCGVIHGDFAPWNTRLHNGQLLCFDWESAVWAAPSMWDVFHFKIQSATLSRRKNVSMPKSSLSDESVLLLYLLKMVLQFQQEGNHAAILYYKKLVLDVLRGVQPWHACEDVMA